MPPETPTTMVRPRSTTALLDRLVVEVGNLAADRALQGGRRHLARDVLAAALGPLVETPRLARRHDRDLILVGPRGGEKRSQLGHRILLVVRSSGHRARGESGKRPETAHPR